MYLNSDLRQVILSWLAAFCQHSAVHEQIDERKKQIKQKIKGRETNEDSTGTVHC